MGIKSIVLAAITLVLSTNANSTIFPIDSEWVAATQGGSTLVDPTGDVLPNFDIVGEGSDAAFYVSANNEDLFFRLRLANTPYNDSTSKFSSFSSRIYFDTDGNASNYENALVFDGNSQSISFYQNSVTDIDWLNDDPEIELNSYFADITNNMRVVGANTSFGGLTDFFLDISMPIADLNAAGIYLVDNISFAMCTGSNNLRCNKDFAGFSAIDSVIGFADPIMLTAVPVPAAVWLFGSGLASLVGVAIRKKT